MYFYIFCTYKTDWRSEALHQLCGAIRDSGEQSFIWYTDENMQNHTGIKPLYQSQYNITTTDKFRIEDIDHPHCVWIISDHHKHSFYECGSNTTRIIWFLDVPGTSKTQIKPESRRIDNCIYVAQTHLGLNQLQLVRRGQPIFKITDYVSDDLMEPEESLVLERRIKQVIFNDLGGQKHIVPIRSALPDVRFTAISKYPRKAIKDLGLKSALYLDLGRHCHLHRRLREMAVLGSSIIAADLNVASSPSDMPIDQHSLVDVSKINEDPYAFSETVKEMILVELNDSQSSFQRRSSYRHHLRNQKQEFYTAVTQLLDFLK